MKRAKFEVYEDVGGEWRWRLVAKNGRVLAQGESHTRKPDAERATRTVQEAVEQIAHRNRIDRLKGKGSAPVQGLRGEA